MVNTTLPRTPAEMFRLYLPGEPPPAPSPTEGCWLWPGPLTRKGYGDISCGGRKARIHRHAHRISYELFVGPIPADNLIRHTCDTPPCCQPAHLIPGLPVDNMLDMMVRQRCGTARLTEADVLELRQCYISGLFTVADLARRFNISRGNVHFIVTRQTWKHI